jgi:hypothetical protein
MTFFEFFLISYIICAPLLIVGVKLSQGFVDVGDVVGVLIFGAIPLLNIILVLMMTYDCLENSKALHSFSRKKLF